MVAIFEKKNIQCLEGVHKATRKHVHGDSDSFTMDKDSRN